jgi:glutaminase
VAKYIPELGNADAAWLGLALRTCRDEAFSIGDADRRFTLQSISKVFGLAALLEYEGTAVFDRVSAEPSGDSFHSIVRLEEEAGHPRNPYINAGALCVTSRLPGRTAAEKVNVIRELLHTAGAEDLEINEAVYESERRTGSRNRALAHYMEHWGVLDGAEEAVDAYFRQCSLLVDARRLARIGLFLANRGVDPVSGRRVVSEDHSRILVALMTTCGLYDAVGDFAIRVGLPAKSGVSGGILAVVPGEMALAAYGPGLDRKGNSVGGKLALEYFSRETGASLFD